METALDLLTLDCRRSSHYFDASDNLDRDKMYAGGAHDSDGDYELAPLDDGPAAVKPARAAKFDDDDDGAELELEPVDAEIIAGEKRRAEEAVDAAKRAVNIDAIYREVEPVRDLDFSKESLTRFRFQFQLKHLLIATAVVAVMLALYKLDLLGTTLIVLFMLAVFCATAYFHWARQEAASGGGPAAARDVCGAACTTRSQSHGSERADKRGLDSRRPGSHAIG